MSYPPAVIKSLVCLCLLAGILAGCGAALGTATGEATRDLTTTVTVESEERLPITLAPPILIGEDSSISYYEMMLADGTVVQYGVVLPPDFDPAQTFPVLLAFPPGAQTQEMVAAGLEGYWATEAQKRGWVVVSPAAPGGVLFFEGSEAIVPEFLARIAELYRPEGGKFHLAGISNGGISAFRVAVNQPALFHSLVVLPGLPPTGEDSEKLAVLAGIPVRMFVGERDAGWRQLMEDAANELSRQGVDVALEIVPGEGHVIRSLEGEQLFDLLDSFR